MAVRVARVVVVEVVDLQILSMARSVGTSHVVTYVTRSVSQSVLSISHRYSVNI